MKFLRSKRGLAVLTVILLILFLFRPVVHQLRDGIANSIGAALGRRVAIDDVRFHVLPRPGFDLEGLVIYDQPAFGAEPMIRAQDVFAAIRLRSLLHGRLEIARLSATEPSINVVRNAAGRWNLASLIERNAQIPAAPTQKAASEQRPAFPYLEATGARINFKIGAEKKSLALTDADVALWQESENSWGARMKAEPVRTDFNLTDTGRLLIDATWERSRNLRTTPVRVTLAWENGQLGQISQLFSGRDRGFRGAVTFAASLSGTPQALAIDSHITVGGFRRYDIVDNRIVGLATHCAGQYSVTAKAVSDLLCESRVSGGVLRLRGRIATGRVIEPRIGNEGDKLRGYDMTLTAQKIPLASAMAILHMAKQQLPADLNATGTFDGEFHFVEEGTGTDFSGSGTAKEVRLLSDAGKDTITLGNVPLSLAAASRGSSPPGSARKAAGTKDSEPAEAHLRIGPATLEVAGSPPVAAGGWVSATGYNFYLRGDLALKNLFRLETALGLPGVRPAAEGDAKLDINILGSWQGLAAPNALGTAQLHNVRAETYGWNAPIVIPSATLVLGQENFSMQKISAQTGETHWTGSVTAPRHCAPGCAYQFDLSADRLSADGLAKWLTPQPAKRPWYRILNATEPVGPSPLLALSAHGKLSVARLELKRVIVTSVLTELDVERGTVDMPDLRATVLQGSFQGKWTVDASLSPLRYRGSGTLQNVSLGQLGTVMNDGWISGNADGNFELMTAGGSVTELIDNADGKLQFVMRDGSLSHILMPGMRAPLSVHRFAGELRAKKGAWALADGRLESRDGLYQVSGTAERATGLNFVLTRSDQQAWNLTGTLAKPHVSLVNQEISRKESGTSTEAKPEF